MVTLADTRVQFIKHILRILRFLYLGDGLKNVHRLCTIVCLIALCIVFINTSFKDLDKC